MEMVIDFPGGARVDAHFGPFTVRTDQAPQGGGAGSAPTPFELFLSSIGTCAGIYVLGFCRQRNLPTDGLRIIQHIHPNHVTGLVVKIDLEIQVPPSFLQQYHSALIHSAELCKVKRTLEQPPQFEIVTREVEVI
jgi:putative redox protein